MKVDIIIPVYKPGEIFCLLLQKLREQTFVIHKLILMNTEKSLWEEAQKQYGIEDMLRALPCEYEICHIKKADFDHGATRKAGALKSDADIMIFMTQDAVPADPYLVERLTAEFDLETCEEGSVAVAYARQLPRPECSIVEQYTRKFNYPENSRRKGKADIPELGIKTFFCSDVCAAYRRDIFWELGGFEEPVIFNEDMFFAAAAVEAGYLIAYAAEARVVHSHNYTMRQQFSRNFDLAVSQKQHPEIFERVSSESEGIKLVKSTVRYLFSIGKPYLIAELGLQCAAKYAGFFMGKRYRKLGRKRILKYSMSKDYWNKVWNRD